MANKKSQKVTNHVEDSENFSGINPLKFVVSANAQNLLLHGKSKGYSKRFASWAKNTSGEHLTNLTDAILSSIAFSTITGKKDVKYGGEPVTVEFLRGAAYGILFMKDSIVVASSETKQEESNNEDDDYVNFSD